MAMRYIIGIDLGTTNSCLSYIDTESKNQKLQVELLRIPQLSANRHLENSLTLPSFCYLEEEGPIVGKLAQTLGAKTPTRLVSSAKSWLCNAAANRQEKILPIEAADPKQRLSPVEASAHYLRHLKKLLE